jgi:hypothetical protein
VLRITSVFMGFLAQGGSYSGGGHELSEL